MDATLLAWAMCIVALAPPEEAPPEPAPRARYQTVVASGRDAGDGLDAQRDASARNVAFVSVIDLDHEPGQAASDELARVISRAPGVTIRSVGGLGQFSAVSLRGSTTQQVAVFLDGAPLSGAAASVVDLSNQPLDGLERVETYSGGTEATAFHPNAVAALARAGFDIPAPAQADNTHYQLAYASGRASLEAFSKVHSAPSNPQAEFAAIMNCSEADEA